MTAPAIPPAAKPSGPLPAMPSVPPSGGTPAFPGFPGVPSGPPSGMPFYLPDLPPRALPDRPVTFKKAPTIAIIDFFTTPSIDLNGDRIPDITHGVAVGLQVKSRIPNAKLLAFDAEADVKPKKTVLADPLEFSLQPRVSFDERRNAIYASLLNQIKRVDKLAAKGQPIDAVNISLAPAEMGESISVDHLATITGLPLTQDNLKENQAKIRGALKELYENRDRTWLTDAQKHYSKMWPLVEGLDKLTARKIPVYVAAGNVTNEVNILGLAKDVKFVGSEDERGIKSQFSADNSLVNRRALGEYEASPIDDGKKVIGFDITGDDVLDIPATLVSNRGEVRFPFHMRAVRGTSYASPTALARDLVKKELETNPPAELPNNPFDLLFPNGLNPLFPQPQTPPPVIPPARPSVPQPETPPPVIPPARPSVPQPETPPPVMPPVEDPT